LTIGTAPSPSPPEPEPQPQPRQQQQQQPSISEFHCFVCSKPASTFRFYRQKGGAQAPELGISPDESEYILHFCDPHADDYDLLMRTVEWPLGRMIESIKGHHQRIEDIKEEKTKEAIEKNGANVFLNLKHMEPNRVYFVNWQGHKYQVLQFTTQKHGTQIQLSDHGEGEWE